ncbi:hypothetical protein DMN91_003941 [Ooceraea biroi]|uniref:Uncharacterized protein n=1 Tax=Ooceraea biroi TaxID=2015173 RepID=A0A3L8DTG1_OOCBI|nr:hypothetical protein DMN91_003941 [Ooceraea biroi]
MPSTPSETNDQYPIVRNLCIQRSNVCFERVRHFVWSAADESSVVNPLAVFKGTSPYFVPGQNVFRFLLRDNFILGTKGRKRKTRQPILSGILKTFFVSARYCCLTARLHFQRRQFRSVPPRGFRS